MSKPQADRRYADRRGSKGSTVSKSNMISPSGNKKSPDALRKEYGVDPMPAMNIGTPETPKSNVRDIYNPNTVMHEDPTTLRQQPPPSRLELLLLTSPTLSFHPLPNVVSSVLMHLMRAPPHIIRCRPTTNPNPNPNSNPNPIRGRLLGFSPPRFRGVLPVIQNPFWPRALP